METKQTVTIILGPTCSGKTTLALGLCKKYGGEIISADSRQVYKFMDIGTGKSPTNASQKVVLGKNKWTLDTIDIWGYDLVDPDEFFSAYDFAIFSLEKARDIISRGKKVILVGGTGFYIDIFTGRIKPSNTKPDFILRKELESLPLTELQKKLMSLNLKEYERVDTKNKVRLIRSIEKNVSGKSSSIPLPYLSDIKYKFIGLTARNNFLFDRADRWFDFVWKNGLIDETEKLLKSKYSKSRKLNGLVYKSAAKTILGNISEAEGIERAKFDLHAYIRRQLTYFKKMPHVVWVNVSNDGFEKRVYTLFENG